MTEQGWAYLNGEIVLAQSARVSPFDRGFLFAHAAYEVTAVYGGELVDFDGHMQRLDRTLAALDIPNPHDEAGWRGIHEALIAHNAVDQGLVYLQVTAGDYEARDFAGPQDLSPNVFAFASKRDLITATAREGIAAITVADTRWRRRDLKTTQLLSQALAYRAARAKNATTAIMHEDGYITEAAPANLWLVSSDGHLMTRDLSPAILPGITRKAIIDQLTSARIDVRQTAIPLESLREAREVFTSSAGALIAPVVEIDGRPVGDGRPGPITRQVQRSYYAAMGADLSAIDWL